MQEITFSYITGVSNQGIESTKWFNLYSPSFFIFSHSPLRHITKNLKQYHRIWQAFNWSKHRCIKQAESAHEFVLFIFYLLCLKRVSFSWLERVCHTTFSLKANLQALYGSCGKKGVAPSGILLKCHTVNEGKTKDITIYKLYTPPF